MKNSFSGYHPIVNFVFFTEVLLFSMWFLHPACLGISFFSALAYGLYLHPRKTARLCLRFLLPVMLVTALVNPAFSHEGVTILTYLPSGNPLTLESILYGLAAAGLLAAVMLWFSCFNRVVTSDKFVYLFGRIIPALSLVLSMALRFVPRFRAQLRVVTDAQRVLGRDISRGKLVRRLRCAGTILSIMVTWALENGIDTADSMKSRGYGLPGRTAFSIYRFDRRDRLALCWFLALGALIAAGAAAGGFAWRWYPSVKGAPLSALTLGLFLTYAALCLSPLILDRKEDRKWTAIRSKM